MCLRKDGVVVRLRHAIRQSSGFIILAFLVNDAIQCGRVSLGHPFQNSGTQIETDARIVPQFHVGFVALVVDAFVPSIMDTRHPPWG